MAHDITAQTPEDAEPLDGWDVWEEPDGVVYELTVQMAWTAWYVVIRVGDNGEATCCTSRRRQG